MNRLLADSARREFGNRDVTTLFQWAIIGLGFLTIALTVTDYGIGWDEYSSSHYGELVLRYFQTGGKDKSCNQFFNLFLYGPTVDLTAAAVYQEFPHWKYEIRHALSAFFAILTVPALVRIARSYGIPRIGVIAGTALILMPRFYGHAFINSKDIPFACGFAWCMCLLINLVEKRDHRWSSLFLFSIALGLTTSIRPGGWILFGILIPPLLIMSIITQTVSSDQEQPQGMMGKMIITFVVAWSVMVLPWPWAHESPVVNPLLAIKMSSSFHAEFPVLFEGTMVSSLHLPWYYLIKMFVVTTPLPILVMAFVGGVVGLVEQRRKWRSRQGIVIFAMLLWLIAPVTIWTILRPNIYDGIRHFLFVLPALAFWAAFGINFVIERTEGWKSRRVILGGIVLAILSPLWAIVRLHPYQMTYYNEWVGGPSGAEQEYETDYWATSFRDVAEWLNERQALQPTTPLKVLVVANQWNRLCIEHYLTPTISVTLVPVNESIEKLKVEEQYKTHGGEFSAEFDFFVAPYRANQSRYYPDSPIVESIGRSGATFAVIKGHSIEGVE